MNKTVLFLTLLLLFSLSQTNAKSRAIQPKKFKQTDIGNPAVAGAASLQNNSLHITAGGADVWGIRDECHFAWLEKSGDFDLAVRVESLTAPHLYTKAGLMAREALTENSRHIFFQLFPNNKPRNKNNRGYEFQYRQEQGGEMKAIYPASSVGTPEFPVSFPNSWIRLQRIGNQFFGYWSNDGNSWKLYASYTMELPAKLYLGLAVTSHNTKEAAAAVFSSISFLKAEKKK